MKSVQGEFATRELGKRAVEALRAAGIAEERIRMWNIVPEAPAAGRSSGGATLGGAVAGAVVGGLGGLVTGAVVGGVIDRAGAAPARRPATSSGVRVVVDLASGGPDPAAILREHGASNVG